MNQSSQNSSCLLSSIIRIVWSTIVIVAMLVCGNADLLNAQSPHAFSLGPGAEDRLANVGPTLSSNSLPASLSNSPPNSLPTVAPATAMPRIANSASSLPWESATSPVKVANAAPQSNPQLSPTQLPHSQLSHSQLIPYYQPAQNSEASTGAALPNPSTPGSPTQSPTQSPADSTGGSSSFNDLLTEQAEQLITREGTGSSVKIAILLAALSLAPALILMTTCYVRVVVVLTLLRQAFGAQQLPSTQILTALSLFVTFLVMAPTWNEIKSNAIDPYTQPDSEVTFEEALQRAVVPVKRFMSRQITLAKNEDSVVMFYRYLPPQSNTDRNGGSSPFEQPSTPPTSMQDVPLNVLLPAFLVSELKVAFLLGFQVYLPFLIVDLVVSSVTVSMGMVMLPPTMVSFPLKLILFVMVDGWALVVGMLMQSFGPL